jgi:hypothetical protein
MIGACGLDICGSAVDFCEHGNKYSVPRKILGIACVAEQLLASQ